MSNYVSPIIPGVPHFDEADIARHVKPVIVNEQGQEQSVTGFIPRDYDKQPLGSLHATTSVPPELLLDDQQIKERIQELERTKTDIVSLLQAAWQAGKWIGLNQDPTNFCATADTEVLTDKGWVLWPDYNGTDLLGTMNTSTRMLEFQAPIACQRLEHDGEMVYSTNKRIDFGVTPDHRMYLRKWDERKRTLSSEFTFQRAKDIGWYAGLPHATKGFIGTDLVKIAVDGDRQYAGDDFIAMASLIASDGYAGGSDSTKNWVSFCCFREDRYDMVAALARRVGFHENPSRRGVWSRYDAPALAEWVRSNCYSGNVYRSPHKRVPDLVKIASQRQIGHFLKFFGDQSHSRDYARSMFSSSKRMVDDLQELLLRVGKRGTIWKPQNYAPAQIEGGNLVTPGGPIHSVGISDTDRLCIDRKKHIDTDHYKGLVYCATVPNGTLITRRNGTILISGNCWCFAVTHAVMILRMLAGEPFKRLSPFSVADIVKNFSNIGGWGGEANEQMVKEGVSTEEFWPFGKPGANNLQSANMAAIRSGRQYLESSRANAALHKVDEFWELQPRNNREKLSVLCIPLPVPSGYNRIGHERCSVKATILANGAFGCIDLDSYTDDGSPDLKSFALNSLPADDAVVPRVVSLSDI